MDNLAIINSDELVNLVTGKKMDLDVSFTGLNLEQSLELLQREANVYSEANGSLIEFIRLHGLENNVLVSVIAVWTALEMRVSQFKEVYENV